MAQLTIRLNSKEAAPPTAVPNSVTVNGKRFVPENHADKSDAARSPQTTTTKESEQFEIEIELK